MKIQLLRNELLEPLQKVSGVVDQKQTLPILSNVLIDIKDNKLSVVGTDMEIELIGTIELTQKKEDQKLTLPCKKLIDICKALPEDALITLSDSKGQIILTSGRSRFSLATLPAEEFPNMEKVEEKISFSVSQAELKTLLQRTSFAMAHQDIRYYLNGTLLEINAHKIRAVATDGHRLATHAIDVSTHTDHRIQIILPRKAVLELLRLTDEKDQDITIVIGSGYIRVSHPLYTFTSKLIEGRFPNYQQVIPKTNDKQITLNKEQLKRALGRSAILCNEKFKSVRLELRNNLLRILANNPEHEAAEEELQIIYPYEDINIGFNVNYLIENINILQTEDVTLSIGNAQTSMLIEETDCQHDSAFVIMPMRT